MELDIVDQYSMSVECFNHDVMEGDTAVGAARLSLLPVFKQGGYSSNGYSSIPRRTSWCTGQD